MKESFRRIFAGTLIVGLLALSGVTFYQAFTFCTNGQPSCLVAAVTFGVADVGELFQSIESTHSVSTPDVVTTVPSMTEFFLSFIQVVSVYLILISVVVLVVLESLELRYLKQLLRKGHA